MINKLTKAQEEKFKTYVDKWLTVGLSKERIDFKDAKPIIDKFYTKILNKPTVPIIIMDSPIMAWFATCYVAGLFGGGNQVRNQVENQVWNQVENQVENQVRNQVVNQVVNQVRNQVVNQVWNQVVNQVRNQVENQVWNQVVNQVWNQVVNQVWNQVENQVWNQVENQVKDFVWPYISGNMWAGWFSFYDFIFEEVIKLETDLFNDFKEMSKLHLVYPLDQACILSQKPTEINMVNGLLHKDGSPAIKYADGFSVWSLNGVRVPQELAETPADKLTLDFFKKEKNADVKAEFIRKYGVERMVGLGKVIETASDDSDIWWQRSEYQLVDMGAVFERDYAPFLKMKNLTTGIYHMEGVSPECKTIDQAIKFRCGGKNIKIMGIK